MIKCCGWICWNFCRNIERIIIQLAPCNMDNIRPDKDHHVLMCRKILQTRKASPKYHLEYVKLLNTYCNTSTQSDNNGLTNKCMENIKKKGNWFISRQWVLINLFVMNVDLFAYLLYFSVIVFTTFTSPVASRGTYFVLYHLFSPTNEKSCIQELAKLRLFSMNFSSTKPGKDENITKYN